MKNDEITNFATIQDTLLPDSGIDDYYLYIYPDVPPRCTTGFVGFVGSTTNPNIQIKLEIDHEWMVENNYITIALWINEKKFPESRIVMTPRFFHDFRNNPFLQFDLWHEIGHYHTLRYFSSVRDGNGTTNKVRMEYIESEDIMPEEKAADAFALYYTSKDDAIESLSESIRRRHTYTWESKEITNKAIEEFRRRKQFLRELNSEDKVREALCKLCGKSDYLEI